MQAGSNSVRAAGYSTTICYSLQPENYSSLPAPNFQPTATQEPDGLSGNKHYTRELLMKGIAVPETCWAYRKYNKTINSIELVLILQLSQGCTVQYTSNINKLDDGYHPERSSCRSALLHCLYNIHSCKFAFWRNSVTESLTSGFWESYCVLLNRKILNWIAVAKWYTDEISNSITGTTKHAYKLIHYFKWNTLSRHEHFSVNFGSTFSVKVMSFLMSKQYYSFIGSFNILHTTNCQT